MVRFDRLRHCDLTRPADGPRACPRACAPRRIGLLRTLRRHRTIKINTGNHILTAEHPLPDRSATH